MRGSQSGETWLKVGGKRHSGGSFQSMNELKNCTEADYEANYYYF